MIDVWDWRNSNFRPTATCLEHCSIVFDPKEETLRCPSWETRAPYVTCLLYTICCNIVCLTSFPFSDCCAFTGINKSHISCNKWRRVRFHKSRTWQNEKHDDDDYAQSYSRIFSHSNSIIIFAQNRIREWNDEKWFGIVWAQSNRNRMERKNRSKDFNWWCQSSKVRQQFVRKWQVAIWIAFWKLCLPSSISLALQRLHFPTMSSRRTNSALDE